MNGDSSWRPTRTQILLASASLLAYAVGYPVALIAHRSFGWLLVMAGGLFLLGLGGVTIPELLRWAAKQEKDGD